MSTLNDLLLGTGALAVTEVASGWAVSQVAWNIAASVTWTLSWAVSTVAPYFTSPLAPLAVAAGSLWDWSWKMKEKWFLWVTEKTALNYGIVASVLGAAGVLNPIGAWTALAVGAGMFGVRHLAGAWSSIAADPAGKLGSAISAPFRWIGWLANTIRGKWSPATA
jgi:hypothetical protein